MTQLDVLDVSIDTNRNLLSIMLYTIKSLRNSVAHNNIIFDTRFKDRKISPVLKKWIEKETSIHNITLYSLIDYIIIVCCLVKRVDFSSTRAKKLVHAYKNQNQILQNSVAPAIYAQIIQKKRHSKDNLTGSLPQYITAPQTKIYLAFFQFILYIISIERGVCFRTTLGESLCGSLLRYSYLT